MRAVFFLEEPQTEVVVGSRRVTKGWMVPTLCKMRGSHTRLVWVYRMKYLDVRDVELQGKEYVHILPPVIVQGNGVTSTDLRLSL